MATNTQINKMELLALHSALQKLLILKARLHLMTETLSTKAPESSKKIIPFGSN